MNEKTDVREIMEKLRILSPQTDPYGTNKIPMPIPNFEKFIDSKEIEIVDAEVEEIEIVDPTRDIIIPAASCRCYANKINRIPFVVANYVHWHVTEILWKAGGGSWPWYNTYCPRYDYDQNALFPAAFRHQIVPIFGGYYWIGCYDPGWGKGQKCTAVYFAVNDNKYQDNEGSFYVRLINYACEK